MNTLLAIDPGPVESAWVHVDVESLAPLDAGKEPNVAVRARIRRCARTPVVIEMVASYGMPVGAEVFETCVEIGRFIQCASQPARLVYRRDVKLHHCGSPRANDASIIQALVDRFAHGRPNRGKGTKDSPGWFYGFARDVWQAYALAVHAADAMSARPMRIAT